MQRLEPTPTLQMAAAKLSDAETKYLIELYRGYDVLWNRNNNDYKSQHHRNKALESIRFAMSAKFGIQLEVGVIKVKLQSFRNSFSKELGLLKVARSTPGTDDAYAPKYPYFNQLQFLAPVVKKRPSIMNVDDAVQQLHHRTQSTTEEDEWSPMVWFPASSEKPQDEEEDTTTSSENLESDSSASGCGSPVHVHDAGSVPSMAAVPADVSGSVLQGCKQALCGGQNGRPAKRKSETEALEVLKNIVTLLEKRLSHPNPDTAAHRLKTWGLNLVNEISELKDPKRQKRVQIQISRIVQDALLEELQNTE